MGLKIPVRLSQRLPEPGQIRLAIDPSRRFGYGRLSGGRKGASNDDSRNRSDDGYYSPYGL
jgi:hypothetical protein